MAIIKAGAYRFNDFPAITSENIDTSFNFNGKQTYAVSQELADEINSEIEGSGLEPLEAGNYGIAISCSELSIGMNSSVEDCVMRWGGEMTTCIPESQTILALFAGYIELTVYDYNTYEDGGNPWSQNNYVTSKIITVPTDQEVSEEFALWFNENTKPIITVEYNGTLIASLEYGQTAELDCADMLMSGNIVVTTPSITHTSTVEEWDGSYTITDFENDNGNSDENTEPVIITFTINSTNYQALSGMTWNDWINSEYSNSAYSIINDKIGIPLGLGEYTIVSKDGSTPVAPTELITTNFAYITYIIKTGGSNE